MAEPRYRIGAVARLAGLTTHAIRVWERRYGVLTPNRSSGGARLYSESELEHLRQLKRATDRGHSIGQIARLAPADLARLAAAPSALIGASEVSSEALLDELVATVQSFDSARAKQLLDRASARLSARALLFEVLAPLLRRVGDGWARGQICAASEHMANALVRDHAGSLLRQFSQEPGAPMLVATTLAGELHEIGALLAAITAAMQGFGVVYLGPNLPAAEICQAVRGSNAGVLALSLVGLDDALALSELRALIDELPSAVDVVLGGFRARELALSVGKPVVAPGNLDDFERWLSTRRALKS